MHAQLITAALALAGSAFAGKVPKIHTTSTVTFYEPHPTESTTTAEHPSACTVCPKDYDRNWEPDRVINDTRKHHSSFKLFAYLGDEDSAGGKTPLHVVSHKDSRDNMWQLKFSNLPHADDNSDVNQPKWNLHDNSLQTDGSAPINKPLYFRLYDAKYPKDTENWTGPVYHPIATTIKDKKKYKNERNAKLIADKCWSLVREHDDPYSYTLKGSKPAGNFFACVVPEAMKVAANEAIVAQAPADAFDGEEPDAVDMLYLASAMMAGAMASNLEIVYSAERPRQEFTIAGNSLSGAKGCFPINIKAEGWTHPKQT